MTGIEWGTEKFGVVNAGTLAGGDAPEGMIVDTLGE